jgi:hypothetical protein
MVSISGGKRNMCSKPEHEVKEQLRLAEVRKQVGTRWPAMSYEEGVAATLQWLLGVTDEVPIEEGWMPDGVDAT